MDYIHYNPVKHGYVSSVKDWKYSTFHQCVRDGFYAEDWASQGDFGEIGENDG
jgi:putative transposase